MGKIRLYILNMRANLLLNIILVLQMGFVFLIINANISDLLYQRETNYYLKELPSNVYFLSGTVSMNVQEGNKNAFFDFVKRLEDENHIKVGYQIEDGVFLKDYSRNMLSCFYLNSVMKKLQYPLSDGYWFDESDSNQIEVILGGTIAEQYEVGESIIIYQRIINTDNKAEYFQTEAIVIGKLERPVLIFELGIASNYPTYRNLFKEYENIILTDQLFFIEKEYIRYPLSSLIFEDLEENTKQSLSDYGQIFTFKQINEYSKKSYFDNIKSKIAPNLILLIIIIFGIIGTTYLFVYKCMKTISIFFLCGMNRNMNRKLLVLNNMIIVFWGFIFFIILYFQEKIQEKLFARAVLGWWNLAASFIIFLISFLITWICSYTLTVQPIIYMIRRYE